MRFKHWLIEDNKELARAYRGLLQDVPQDPVHHKEGSALIHSQLVRKAIPKAVAELTNLKNNPQFLNILSDIDFTISSDEFKLLFLAAFLHDIGKESATTIDPHTKRIQAIGHQDPEHYLPQLQKLKGVAPKETVDLYLKNSALINFLIERHMDFINGGFPADVLRKYFQNGKVKNSQEMKLLLILMWADKMGRKPEESIAAAIAKNAEKLIATSNRSFKKDFNIANQSKPLTSGPAEMNTLLTQRGVDSIRRFNALKSKFPDLSDQEIGEFINQ